jgi:hypothetical protein
MKIPIDRAYKGDSYRFYVHYKYMDRNCEVRQLGMNNYMPAKILEDNKTIKLISDVIKLTSLNDNSDVKYITELKISKQYLSHIIENFI